VGLQQWVGLAGLAIDTPLDGLVNALKGRFQLGRAVCRTCPRDL